ncbi:hypothetical protein AUK40_02300 [Candidatus Wirthbacteria bacterium CG2_30_54_11]|uniref:Uncharacterized protein n=1 Tax=Candidatus Wirthbacteria bacterium CG2_30_54_11 TaxID=1817892 RepID=A0A1J5IL98_9BACT|nr:MAG: hypothetical protein AUK40_02300 [Candidatus Wirthbacteria bacterium CG2_30_54_11]
MSVTRTVLRNTIFQSIGRVVYMITSLLMIKVMTGYLGQEGFGRYNIAVDYLGFFGVLVDMGLYLLLVQAITTIRDEKEKALRVASIVGLRIISIAAVFSLAAGLIFLFPYDMELKLGIVACTLAFVLISLAQLYAGVFQGYLRTEYAAFGEALGRVINFVLVVMVTQMHLGLMAIFLTLIIGNAANLLFNLILSRQFLIPRVRFSLPEFKAIFKDAAPLGLMLAISYLYVKQATIILSLYPHLPGGITNAEAVGIYKAPFKLLETIQGFPALFLVALFPFLTKYLSEHDERVKSMCQKAFDFLTMLAVPMLVGTIVLADRIIPVITSGGDWSRSILCLRILIVAVAFSFLNNFAGHLLIAQKQQKRLIIPNLCYLGINFVLNLVLMPYLAYNASAIATVVTEVLVLFVNFRIIYLVMGWRPGLRILGKVSFVALVMGLAVYGLDRLGLNFFLNAAVGAVLYFWLLSAVRGLPEGMTPGDVLERLKKTID